MKFGVSVALLLAIAGNTSAFTASTSSTSRTTLLGATAVETAADATDYFFADTPTDDLPEPMTPAGEVAIQPMPVEIFEEPAFVAQPLNLKIPK